MFFRYLYELVSLEDAERQQFIRDLSAILCRSGGDAGAIMLNAYYQTLSEPDIKRRTVMLELLERVRVLYVNPLY